MANWLRGCPLCAQITFLIGNVLILIFGLAVVGVAAWVIVRFTAGSVTLPPGIGIGIGLFIALVAVLGIAGAATVNRCAIAINMIFVLLGLLAFIALIVLVAIGVAYIAVYGETLWLELCTIGEYGPLASIESEYSCCGLTGVDPYANNTYCVPNVNGAQCPYASTCDAVLSELLANAVQISYGVISGIIVFCFITVVLSCVLMCADRHTRHALHGTTLVQPMLAQPTVVVPMATFSAYSSNGQQSAGYVTYSKV